MENTDDLTPNEIASVNAGYWAVINEIKLQNGIFSFKDHEYQLEIMGENVRRTCDMKATQGGFTEMRALKSLHGLRYGHYPQGVLYLFPTNDDVREFSKSRFKPLLQANRHAIGQFVKDTDTASLKKVVEGFLYLRGARISQVVKDEHKESVKLRSIPVDCVVFDEVDLFDEDVSEKARQRMGHSAVKEEHYLSNPTVPGYGIDALFQKSDQRHWFRKCQCGEFTCAELSFPDCVKIREDGTGYIACNKCGKELGISPGEWVPAQRENTAYMVGRRWSQLTSTFNDPAEILEDYINPPEGNLGDVMRLRLGLPYIAAEDKLRESDVFACCGSDLPCVRHDGPCAMGVDVGKKKHIVIGARTGVDKYEIFKTAKLSAWGDIHDLAQRFNVRSAVIDIRPYEDMARQFQSQEKYRVWLCEYSENTPLGWTYSQNTGIVKVNRTEIFDATHRMVTQDGMLTLPRVNPEMREFAKQLCAPFKILEENKKTHIMTYRYKNSGEDHFRHALNYFYLAASGGKVARVDKYRKKRQMVANNDYARI